MVKRTKALVHKQDNNIPTSTYTEENIQYRYVACRPDINLDVTVLQNDFPCKVEQCEENPLFYRLEPLYESNTISHSSLYRTGKIIAMDLSSGMAVHYLDLKEGDHVLDLCCAPGNKLTLSALLVGQSGSVTGVDISASRMATTRSIVKKYKPPRVRLFCENGCTFDKRPFINDPRGNATDFKCFYSSSVFRKSKGSYNPDALYDKVLVDAQCTHDGSVKHVLKCQQKGWSQSDIDQYSPLALEKLYELQYQLLLNGFRLLKPGGILVYSTCSLSRRQNEEIVERFINSEPSSKPCPFGQGSDSFMKRFDPEASKTGGFFIARLTKVALQGPGSMQACSCGLRPPLTDSCEGFELINNSRKQLVKVFCSQCAQFELQRFTDTIDYYLKEVDALGKAQIIFPLPQADGLLRSDSFTIDHQTGKKLDCCHDEDDFPGLQEDKLEEELIIKKHNIDIINQLIADQQATSKLLSELTMFNIDVSQSIGSINSLRLGRSGLVKVSASEFNAALGQCCLLLQCLANAYGINFNDAGLFPSGPYSRIETSQKAIFPLFIQQKKIDQPAISRAFEDALHEFLKMLNVLSSATEAGSEIDPAMIALSYQSPNFNQSLREILKCLQRLF